MNNKQDRMPKPAEQHHQQHPQHEEFKKHVQDPNDPQNRQNYPQNRRWTDKLQNERQEQTTK